MANLTFIEFKSRGFWIPPSFIEVLCDYICGTFESVGISTFSQNLQDIYEDCDTNRKGSRIGIVDIPLDEYIINSTDTARLINVLNQTQELIASEGIELSIETLEDFESRKTDDYFNEPWAFPIKTQSLITTIDIIIKMLNGTWTSGNYSAYYTGFPNPMNMPEI
jgi:hypothetical protein